MKVWLVEQLRLKDGVVYRRWAVEDTPETERELNRLSNKLNVSGQKIVAITPLQVRFLSEIEGLLE